MSSREENPPAKPSENSPLEYVHGVSEIRDILTAPVGGRTALDLLIYSGMWGEEHPSVALTFNWNYPAYCNMYNIIMPPEEMHAFRPVLQIDGQAWMSLYAFNHWLPYDLYREQSEGARSQISKTDANKIRSLVEPHKLLPDEKAGIRNPLAIQRIEAGMPRTVRVLSGILAMKYSNDPSISNGHTQDRVNDEGVALFGLNADEASLAEELYANINDSHRIHSR